MSLDKIEENIGNLSFIQNRIISVEKIFEDKEKVVLDGASLEKFLNGVKLEYGFNDGVYRVYDKDGLFLGLGVMEYGRIKRDVVI